MYNVISKIKPGLNQIISFDNKVVFNQGNCIGSVLDKWQQGAFFNIFISIFDVFFFIRRNWFLMIAQYSIYVKYIP